MPLFAGQILDRVGADAVAGWVEVEEGRLLARGEGEPPRAPDAQGWILPAPVNAHTHVADTCLRGVPGRPPDLASAVGPGGWKEQQMRRAKPEQMEAGILRYTGEMAAVGTSAFIDFREGGLAGVRAVAQMELPLQAVLYGRPAENRFVESEIEDILEECAGIGLSARRDFARPRDVEEIAQACHEEGRPLALHVSEVKREPMESVIALEPTFLVHATAATPRDWEDMADAGIPLVVCPRSNAAFGIRTPLPAMMAAGLEIAVGTDNGMMQDGDLRRELGLLHSWYPDISTPNLLALAVRGRKLAGLAPAVNRVGQPLDLVVWPEQPFPVGPDRRPGLEPRTLDAASSDAGVRL